MTIKGNTLPLVIPENSRPMVFALVARPTREIIRDPAFRSAVRISLEFSVAAESRPP
jgi:hypothetical protein